MTEKMCSIVQFCIKRGRKPFCRIFKLLVVLLIETIRDDHLMVHLVLATLTSTIVFSILWSIPLVNYYLRYIHIDVFM